MLPAHVYNVQLQFFLQHLIEPSSTILKPLDISMVNANRTTHLSLLFIYWRKDSAFLRFLPSRICAGSGNFNSWWMRCRCAGAGSLGTGRLVGTIVQHWPRSETMCLPWSPRPRPAPPPPRLGHLDNGALALITGTLWHWQQSSPVNTPSFVANTITWIVSRQINNMVAWQQIQILKNYSFFKRNIRSNRV